MAKIRIVTDSAAQFVDPGVVARYGITVVPHTLTISGQRFRENVDLDSAGFFRLAGQLNPHASGPSSGSLPMLTPPTAAQFADVYKALHRDTDRILSIHLSAAMSAACDHAQEGSRALLGRCTIQVIDSMTASVGLAMLVEAAARLAETTDSVDHITRALRKYMSGVYTIFYTESFGYLQRAGLVSESQATLGAMLNIKPFLTIEDGELVAMEKVRTRAQAIDKLLEFAAEFEPTDQAVILHSAPFSGEATRQLQDRLSAELGWPPRPLLLYQPSLGAYIGTDALGMVVVQNQKDS